MKTTVKLTIVLFSVISSACCNRDAITNSISNKLDSGDLRGAIYDMESDCASKIVDINVTKYLLIYRISMMEKTPEKRLALRREAIDGLISEEKKGSRAASEILSEYNRTGYAYFDSFPWTDLIGPGRHPRQPHRIY